MKINKLANGFFPSATATVQVGGAIKRYKNKYGGLWVGGRVVIDDERLRFTVNALNRAVHTALPEVDIPLSVITAVHYEFGWFTGIVVVVHQQGEFRFRCYGAKRVAEVLSRQGDCNLL